MAGTKALNVRMNFQVDTTQARQQIQQLGAQLNSITKASNFGMNSQLGITSQILEATKAASQLKTALAEAVNPLTGNLNLTAFNDQLRASGMSLSQYRDQLSSLGSIGNQTFNSLARSIATAETPLLRTGKAAQQMWTVLGNTVRWQATSSIIHGVMNTASQAMNYVKNLDSSLNSIRIVTGQSQAQMEKFAKTANQAAKELNTSTNAYAQASLIYYQQGLSNKEVEARTATTIKLANVAGETASKVSNQLTSIWNNFYDGSKSLEYYADVMTALGASTASSTDEIAKGLEKFSSIAKTTGLSYEYATSALATVVANTRQSADSVGTSFKTLFSRLQGLSLGETLDDGTTLNKYSKALSTIGVNIKNANGSLKDMDSILDEIGTKWTTLSKAEQVALAQTIGGARNYTGLVSLMDNWDDFQVNLKTAQQAQGTLQNQADIYAQSWEAASKHVRSASETIYKNLLDDKVFKGLTNLFGYALDGIGAITEGLGGFGGTMLSIVSLGSKFFGNQMANSLDNVFMSFKGRNEAIKMQEETIASLKEPISISKYSGVNSLATQINTDLSNNIIEYRKAVETGKMPSYLQSGYNQLMNIVDTQGTRALQATEIAEQSQQRQELMAMTEQAKLNVAGRYRTKDIISARDQAQAEYYKYIGKASQTGDFSSAEAQRLRSNYLALDELTSGSISPMSIIRQEEQQARALIMESFGTQGLQGIFGAGLSENGTLNEQQMKQAIGFTQRAIAGVTTVDKDGKIHINRGELETVFGKQNTKNLLAFNDAIGKIGSTSKLSQQDLETLNAILAEDNGMIQTLSSKLDVEDPNSIATSFEATMSKMEKQVRAMYGETEGSQAKTDAYMANLRTRLGTDVEAEYNRILEKGTLKEANDYLKGQLKLVNEGTKTVTTGQAVTSMTQTFASVGTAVLAGVNAIKTFGNESATAGQKASALVTAMGTMPMAISSATKFIGEWNTKIGDSNISMKGATLATLGLTAAIGATVFAVKQVQLSSNTSAIKALGEQAAVATQAVSDAQAKYDNLLSGRESQNNLLNKLYSLEKGTEGFSLALVNANEAARNLIDQYDLMYGEDYNYGTNGEIVLNQASLNQKEQDAIENLESVSRGKALNTYAETLLSLKEDAENSAELGTEVKNFLSQNIDTSYTDQITKRKSALIEQTTDLSSIINEYGNWYSQNFQLQDRSFEAFLNSNKNGDYGRTGLSYAYNRMTEEQQKSLLDFVTQSFGNNLNNITTMMASFEEENGESWQTLSGEQIRQNLAQYTNNPDLAANSEIQQRRRAAALGMIETAGQAADIQDDLTKFAIKYMESNPNAVEYQTAIAKAMYNAETTTFVEKLGNFFGFGNGQAADLELLYKTLFETQIVPEDLKKDEEQLKLAVATKFGEYLNLNGLSEDIIDWIGQDALVNLEGFQGLNEIREQLEQNPILKNLTNYSSSNISDIYAQVEELQKYFNGENGQFYQNIALTLTDEISRTQTDLLQTLSTYASDTTFENIQTMFQSLLGQYDLSQLQQITGYITQAGSVFGENSFRNLTSSLMKGVNQKTLDNLNKVNWDTTFSALNDISRLATNIGGERNIYSEILNGAIDDLGAEGGIFQKLYNSSGFQKVIENLTEQFDTMGTITAEYVNKLASKNEDLNAVLGLGRSGYVNINTAGLASLFTAINAGQIKSSQVSSALVSSLSTAGALEGAKQEAFNIVDNQDFGRSGTDLLEYFTNGQKVYLNSKSQNLTFDTPLRNFFEHMMPTEVRNAYYAANEAGNGKSFDQIIKDSDIPQSVKDFLNHTNKKGTKGVNTWSDVIDLYGGFIEETPISEELKNEMLSGLSPEIQAMLGENSTLNDYMREVYGLEFKNGNIHLFEREGEAGKGYKFTTKETEEHLTKIFSQFMSPADAAAQASVWTAYIGENSSGTHLLKNDAQAAIEELRNKQGNIPGGKALYSPEEIQTAFNTYGYWAGINNYDDFQQKILSGGGRIAPELEANFWQNRSADASLIAIGEAYSKANNLNLEDGQVGFEELLKDFGAYDQNGNIDFNKFSSLIEFLGGSTDQINSLLDGNEAIFNNINTHFMDRFGITHDINRRKNETAEQYQQRVNREQNEANSEYFSYTDENGQKHTIHDPLGYMREHYHAVGDINEETGEAYTEKTAGWEEGYNPGLTPQSISVGADGTIYGLSQTGEVIQQDENGQWRIKAEIDAEKTTTKPETTTKFTSKPEKDSIEGAGEDVIVSNPDLNTDRTVIPASKYHGTVLLSDAGEYETAKAYYDQLDAQGAFAQGTFQAFRDAVWGGQGNPFYFQPDITSDEEEELERLKTEVDNARTVLDTYDDEIMAGETGTGITRGEALGISKEEAEANISNAQEKVDLYTYQNMMSPAERLAAITDAQTLLHTDGADKLTPFQKFLMNAIGEIDEHTGTLVEYGEGDEEAAARARNAHVDEETGELVDEEGNPIQLPEGQQSSDNRGNGRDSGDTGSGVGSSGGEGSGGHAKRTGPAGGMQDFLTRMSNAGLGVGDVVTDKNTGERYRVVEDDEGNVGFIDPDTGKDKDFVNAVASGQNNARLLAYASGKEGHIAVTGELGPELRVKSDGSMDILGKTGREYAWVEPDDKIYTAVQSAGILKSNKIPGLEGLAKGINNYIPGYATSVGSTDNPSSGSSGGSSSGGSGRGGGSSAPTEKDPRYDPNTLKIRDILERYYTILQKIDDITRAVEKFSKVADRAWGQDRIKAIEKQTALYQQQYDAQKKYVQEIGEYMNTDSAALTTMIREFVDGYNEGKEDKDKLSWARAQFDSNGVLTNYRDFVEKLVEQYNANAEANAMDKEAQYKFQEQLKDIQMYTDTLNLWESETDKLQELANQILDNSLKEITYRVEYELELNADQKRLLDFQDSFVKDDIFRVAEHISNMNDEIANTADSLEKTRKGLYDYLGTLAGENMRAGEFYDDVALGIATRDEQGLVSAKNYDDIDFKQVSNTIDSWINKLSKEDAEEVNKIVQRDSNKIITNYRDVVNKINEMNKKLSSDSIFLLLNDAQQFFDKISDLTNNPKWTGLSTEMKDQITNYMDQMIQYIQSMGAEFQEIVESMGDSIKAFGKKIDSEIDEFDYYGDVYKSFGNIIDLTNQHMTDITADFFNTLNSKALDNNINKIEAARRRYDLFTKTLGDVQAQYNAMLDRLNNAQGVEEKAFYQQRVDELKEQLDIANSQMESAHKDFLQSWEDALSKIQESYKSAIEQASKDFEKGFSPLFNTLALLQAQFDREKALGDLYVDNYQKIHDLNKLNRDIDQSISDTDNLKSKGRLRDLQKEIRDLQEDGTELSEYDLDILDKKYKLELARQALEDARDAKSIVRLSRDNNGNWGYVYTADEDEIAEAEQNYEDAIRDMEEANQNYIDNIQDQILQVQQEAQQAILALQPEDFATYDDYLAAVQNIQNSMYQTLDYLRSQLNNAFGNNDWLETIVPGIVKDHDLTNDFANTPLAQLLVNGNLDSMIDNAKTNLQENLIQPALESFTIYSEKQKEVYAAAGKDMATIGQTFGKEMDTLTEKSEEQVDVVMKLADRVEDSFGKTMDAVIKATNNWLDKIKDVVKEYDILLEKITELKKIDGEYIEPHKTINDDNAIDTWEELDRFKRELADNGTINLITTDTATGKEKATKYVAGTQATLDFLHGVTAEAAKKEIIDVGEDVEDTEDQNVRDYIKQRGLVWVKYKDDSGEHEIMFNSVEEWEEWYKKHKHVDPPADTSSSSSNYDPAWESRWWSWHNDNRGWWDTGGYTGRWWSADTGMYTGEWPSGSVRRNGRLAFLHQKELVLNAHDTENFLDAMQVVRQLDNLTNWMANGLGDLIMPKVTGTDNELEQNVHIEAEFPNVTDHNEIEQAFTNLVNMASQYANRK